MLTKFRCRHLKTHEIVAYEVIQDNTWMVSHDDNFEKWLRGTWWVDCIREQFTGLLDKNGKEIYEGDIITNFGVENDMKLRKYEIKFNEDGARFFIEYRRAKDSTSMDKWSMRDCEIIGNTLSNPDLISPDK